MKRIMLVWVCLILIISFGSFGSAESNSTANTYTNALAMVAERKYAEAARIFYDLGDYSDAPQFAMFCSAIANAERGLYASAVSNLTALGNFRDSALRALYYTGRNYEALEMYEDALEIYSGISSYLDSTNRLVMIPTKILERDYRRAIALEDNGALEAALREFLALASYLDSAARADAVAEKIKARDYEAAEALENSGKLEEALEAFRILGQYSDSAARADAVAEKIKARDYEAAEKAEASGDYTSAYDGFLALGDYQDSSARALNVEKMANYAQAMEHALSGDFSKAHEMFLALGEYRDSAQKAYVTGISTICAIQNMGEGIGKFAFHNVFGLINVNENITTAPTWEEINDFDQYGMAKVKKNEKYGYINTKGEVVIPCEWDGVSPFKNEYCTIMVRTKQEQSKNDSNYLFGIMNTDGNTIMKAEWRTLGESHNEAWNSTYMNYPRCNAPDFNEGMICAQNKDGLWGFFDEKGSPIGDVEWDEIVEFSDGLAVVKKNGLFGFINKAGEVVIEPQYLDAHSFSEGLAGVHFNTLEGNVGGDATTITADSLYAMLISMNADEYDSFMGVFYELCFSGDNELSLLEQITMYFAAGEFKEAAAKMVEFYSAEVEQLVTLFGGDQPVATVEWGFIDHHNQTVIKPQYTQVSSFTNGLCDVHQADTGWQIIDKKGDIVYFK